MWCTKYILNVNSVICNGDLCNLTRVHGRYKSEQGVEKKIQGGWGYCAQWQSGSPVSDSEPSHWWTWS